MRLKLAHPIFDGAEWAAAGLIDADLSFLSFLELYRTDVAERRMTARRVVEPPDVIEHIGAGMSLDRYAFLAVRSVGHCWMEINSLDTGMPGRP